MLIPHAPTTPASPPQAATAAPGSWSYRLEHLNRMTTPIGIFEHASGTAPRIDHGYCTDDNARLLLVTSREPDEGPAHRMSRIALSFVLDAQSDAGLVRNRFRQDGTWRWVDGPDRADWWGRAVWGLGAASACHPNPWVRERSRWGFDRSVRQRSQFPHAMAFAALGAADVAISDPSHDPARRLAEDAAEILTRWLSPVWPWPVPRLTYASATLAEAVMASGIALEDERLAAKGLHMLTWLMDDHTEPGHLSVVGVPGRGPGERGPQFDQQPIEVAAVADACWRAWMLTGDRSWTEGIALAADWFAGRNDSGVTMFDTKSGGSYDGLKIDGRNPNQGAESTLALVSTMQRARALLPQPSTAVLGATRGPGPREAA